MKVGYKSAQVVIAGGGVTGVNAAINSARNGVETLLIERYGFLGGMFTGGNMTVLNCPPVGGIGKEIIDRLTEQGFAKRCPDDPPNYPIFHYASEYCTMNILYDAEMAKIALFEMVKEAGVKLLLHTLVSGVIVENRVIKGVIVENKSGRQLVEGNVIIDATADGLLLIGEPYWIDLPPETAYDAMGVSKDEYVSLDDTLDRFESAGMRLVEMVLANHDGWDRYEAPQWMAVDDFLCAHPNDPDAPALNEWISKNRHAYFKYGRRYFGWGVFVLRLSQ